MRAIQLSLLGREEPAVAPDFSRCRRTQLDPRSFLDYAPQFVCGDAALLEHLTGAMAWNRERRVMYDREVDVPRLTARVPEDGAGHPLLTHIATRLRARYGVLLDAISLALYRDGNDSVAWHSDRVRDPAQSLVAIVSLGDPRRFMLRPSGGGAVIGGTAPPRSAGAAIVQGFGQGDLLVMGGACQAGFQHCIPKTKRAQPRLSVMFRNRAAQRER